MAEIEPGLFTKYKFTGAEQQLAYIFTDLQLKHIHTEIAIAAEQRAVMPVDMNNRDQYQFEQEFLRGKIDQLQFLVALHDRATAEFKVIIAEEVARQNASPETE